MVKVANVVGEKHARYSLKRIEGIHRIHHGGYRLVYRVRYSLKRIEGVVDTRGSVDVEPVVDIL